MMRERNHCCYLDQTSVYDNIEDKLCFFSEALNDKNIEFNFPITMIILHNGNKTKVTNVATKLIRHIFVFFLVKTFK